MTKAQNSVQQRVAALSMLNVLYCFLVMFIHVSSEPVTLLMVGSWQSCIVTLLWRAASFVVPGFLFLSGLKLFYHHKAEETLCLRSYAVYLIRRYRAVLRPYLLCVLIYYCYFAATPYYSYQMSFWDYVHYVLVGDLVSHFYYIVILAQFTILLPLWVVLVRAAEKRMTAGVLLAGCLIITMLSSIMLTEMPMTADTIFARYSDRLFTSYLIYFTAGCMAGQWYDTIKACILQYRTWLYLAAGIAFVLDPVLFTIQKMGWISVVSSFAWLHFLYCIAAVIGMFAFALSVQDHMERRKISMPCIVSAVDRVSYPIYLWHCLLIYIVNMRMMDVSSIGLKYGIRFCIVLIGTPLLCIAAQKIRKFADVLVGASR